MCIYHMNISTSNEKGEQPQEIRRRPEGNHGTRPEDNINPTNTPIYGGLQVLGQAVESAVLASPRRPSTELVPSSQSDDDLERHNVATLSISENTSTASLPLAAILPLQSSSEARVQEESTSLDTPDSPRAFAPDYGMALPCTTLPDDGERVLTTGFSVTEDPVLDGGSSMKEGRSNSSSLSHPPGIFRSASDHRVVHENSANVDKRARGDGNLLGDSRKPPKRRKLCLQPPDFEPEINRGGKIRKRYSLEFKIKVARYALSKDPNGRAKGGTVGPRYAAAQLGIPEAQSVRDWMRRLPDMEQALAEAQAQGGTSRSQHMKQKKSVSKGRAPLMLGIESQLLSAVEEMGARGGVHISPRLLKDKAREIQPGIFGEAPRGDSLAARRHESKINSWCHRFIRRHGLACASETLLRKDPFAATNMPLPRLPVDENMAVSCDSISPQDPVHSSFLSRVSSTDVMVNLSMRQVTAYPHATDPTHIQNASRETSASPANASPIVGPPAHFRAEEAPPIPPTSRDVIPVRSMPASLGVTTPGPQQERQPSEDVERPLLL